MSSRLVPYAFAREFGLFDAESGADGLLVYFREGGDVGALTELQRHSAAPLRLQVLSAEAYQEHLARAFNSADTGLDNMADDLASMEDLSSLLEDLPELEDLMESADDAPVIRLINSLLAQALRRNASDLHFEMFETRATVRFRIDGQLCDVLEPRRGLHAAMVSRIKIMAALDIAEKRLPQDGRIALRIAGKPVDVRVSTLPTGHGERVVLRLLDKSAGRLDLSRLGMRPETLARMQHLLEQPHGILLVTGPTGSGKTTTLYAALSGMDCSTTNIMTVEDPIEYDLDGIGQTQINTRIDMSFARALRAILRQDPDVIMIGEIRDKETAQIAVQASLTGHLVLATLHTNDAPSAMTRLVDMGIEPFLLASSSLGVLAQRLARRLCPTCRSPYEADAAEMKLLGRTGKTVLYRADGCAECGHTGYQGRTGLYELLIIDDDIRVLIHQDGNEQQIRERAIATGMQLLRDDGIARVLDGETTLEEILRVTREA
ncbi:type II secretion system ATPase GspE [Propionivibrio dicarboxylicus]|uniref:Type II secretion system protein E n=1 Tax=Propionivibrio dicarboxylicus TaxID=83767 RepID=A0A1G8AKS5_9RHOO|nr:type II secretion system ATPase GspE [Propionivibrio dicarboxylicus]SDH21528.1 general secretion pathway protein E [Propionivibrio dicarboxylicus]